MDRLRDQVLAELDQAKVLAELDQAEIRSAENQLAPHYPPRQLEGHLAIHLAISLKLSETVCNLSRIVSTTNHVSKIREIHSRLEAHQSDYNSNMRMLPLLNDRHLISGYQPKTIVSPALTRNISMLTEAMTNAEVALHAEEAVSVEVLKSFSGETVNTLTVSPCDSVEGVLVSCPPPPQLWPDTTSRKNKLAFGERPLGEHETIRDLLLEQSQRGTGTLGKLTLTLYVEGPVTTKGVKLRNMKLSKPKFTPSSLDVLEG